MGVGPLVAGAVAEMFGLQWQAMIQGLAFMSHQLGSFLGGWGAGRLYDIQGNYDLMWWISVGLGVFAAVIHWWIRERPVPRLAAAAVVWAFRWISEGDLEDVRAFERDLRQIDLGRILGAENRGADTAAAGVGGKRRAGIGCEFFGG